MRARPVAGESASLGAPGLGVRKRNLGHLGSAPPEMADAARVPSAASAHETTEKLEAARVAASGPLPGEGSRPRFTSCLSFSIGTAALLAILCAAPLPLSLPLPPLAFEDDLLPPALLSHLAAVPVFAAPSPPMPADAGPDASAVLNSSFPAATARPPGV